MIKDAIVAAGFPLTKEGVEDAMLQVIEAAHRIGVRETPGIFTTSVEPVQQAVPWAKKVSKVTFFELFCRLIEAQIQWNLTMAPPFDRSEHCRLAKAIRAFRQQYDNYPEVDNTERGCVIDDTKSWMMENWDVALLLGADADNDYDWITDDHPTDDHPTDDAADAMEQEEGEDMEMEDMELEDAGMEDVEMEGVGDAAAGGNTFTLPFRPR
ncbi:hypothetical protein GGR56DRAFT_688901 [Xylariaceae sp. FL0804]|nr:hypothetical protein GGR56DRAFT_688901 [Xylariaceae sp. FL0804]